MKKLLTRLYFKSSLLRRVYQLIPLKTRLKHRFKKKLGYRPNFKEPKTLNEKINWLKLYDRSELHPVCADKYLVRAHVAKKIGEEFLIPMVFQSYNPNDLRPENFPDYPFIIKTNHDSSGGFIVTDKNKVHWETLQKDFANRLKFNYDYGKGEWQYRNIKPCILAEKLLYDEEGKIPADYKMHCFNGKLVFSQVDLDRATNHKRNLYDREWNFIPCTWGDHGNGPQVPKPTSYETMVQIAEKLSEDFTYARIDLYSIGKKVYFGEITFYPASGNEAFIPQEYDTKFGEMLTLPVL